MKLRVKEAMGYYSYKTGKNITQSELASRLWPGSEKKSREVAMTKLVRGRLKRVDVNTVKDLCNILLVDANFLFDIKPMNRKD